MPGIDSNSGSVITLSEAQNYVNCFRALYPTFPKGFFVGCNKVELILNQPDCIGIRIYNGYDEKEKRQNLVIVSVDRASKDMTHGIILERLVPCPNICDPTSALY